MYRCGRDKIPIVPELVGRIECKPAVSALLSATPVELKLILVESTVRVEERIELEIMIDSEL